MTAPAVPRPRARLRRVTWSLRTTLTLTIAGLFIAATAAVLAVQVLVTTRALGREVQTISVGSVPGSPGTLVGTSSVEREVGTLRDAVTSTAVTSSVLVLAVFSVLALLIAWSVATRTTRRITAITELADALDPDDPRARIPAPTGSDEIDRLTGTLNGALDRIEDALSAQKQFVANASHELLTPIAAIETSLDAPLTQGRFPEDVRPAVLRALAANRRSAALVASLLQLARAQGQRREVREPVELAGLAGRVVEELGERAAARRIAVDTRALLPVTVAGDPVLLEVAVRNLVENAVTHNVDGGWVDVATGADGDAGAAGLTLTVTSSAPAAGPATDLALLVRPFHRGDSTRLGGAPGSGVGLAVVDAVVRAHGGRLDLARPDGTTFRATLRLPGA